MVYLENCIPEKVGYLIPVGDLHFGDESFKEESLNKLKGYIKWISDNPSSRVVIGGDLFNVATRVSLTSPFEQKKNEFNEVVKLFEPIKKQIVGAIDGNHEQRLIDFANFSLMNEFCVRLGIPYMGISGVVVFRVCKHFRSEPKRGEYRENYKIYFHHTTGGGVLAGGGLNRVEKLKGIVEGCDAYCGFHNHKTFAQPQECYTPSLNSKRMELRRYWLIGCGGYLEYDGSYAEKKMLTPVKLGSPRIRMDGMRHDLHVSL